MTFDISAAEYDIKKFDAVDRGYEIPTLPAQLRKPKRSEEVPTPQKLNSNSSTEWRKPIQYRLRE